MNTILWLILIVANTVTYSQDFTVGVKQSPPFVIKENNEYYGISISLIEKIFPSSDITYVEYKTVSELVSAVNTGNVNIGVGAISITANRDKLIDYTHSYKSSAVGAVYHHKDNNDVMQILIKSAPNLFTAVSYLALWMLCGGLIYWILEHKKKITFSSALFGIFRGLYWASATTTTVGYGDVSAQTKLGRIFSVFWMWASIFAMGTITATIVASVNTNSDNIEFNISESVSGVVTGSASQDLAAVNGISTKSYYNLYNMFESLNNDSISAIMHDIPILKYYIKQNNIQNLKVVDLRLLEDRYAFIAQNGSDYIQQMNQKILEIIETTEWKKIISQY